MTQYGDLPVLNKLGEQIAGPHVPKGLHGNTACIHDHTGCTGHDVRRECRKCGKMVEVFVSKPGSPWRWCLECF